MVVFDPHGKHLPNGATGMRFRLTEVRSRFLMQHEFETDVESKVESKVESTAESKVESKVASKAESKVESKVESKLDFKVESNIFAKFLFQGGTSRNLFFSEYLQCPAARVRSPGAPAAAAAAKIFKKRGEDLKTRASAKISGVGENLGRRRKSRALAKISGVGENLGRRRKSWAFRII